MKKSEFDKALYFVMEAVGIMDDRMTEAITWDADESKDLTEEVHKNYFLVVGMLDELQQDLEKRGWNTLVED